jgi:V8-like Glu-specific endopeptidase
MIRTPVLLLSLTATLPAQVAAEALQALPFHHDSGYLANPAAQPAVVWQQDVLGQGDWLQLHFRDTNLPVGSRLKIFSLSKPEWVQWHDAHSLLDYQGWSCQFLGPVVRVELVAAPFSAGNRALVDLAHDLTFFGGEDSICGTSDDRALSQDPRSCRINSSCSAWLYSDFATGTAGHCVSNGLTSGRILHFNVPLSSASGTPQPAHPDNQYALSSFLQFLNGGVGRDWATMAALRNSNTQLFPGQAQGGWYTIVNPPTAASGQIRITGYGTGNGTAGSAVGNQAQKTHVGNRVSVSTANALAYTADTTGGNSGSPVILEATGEVIGVHTHGGCTSTGGSNKGTASDRSDWIAARQATLALRTVGGFRTYGQGCGGGFGVPALTMLGVPELGSGYTVRVSQLNPQPGLFGALLTGLSDQQWSGGALPSSLDGFGLQGCTLVASDDSQVTLLQGGGIAQRSFNLPSQTAFLGLTLHHQFLGLDPTAPNTVGAVMSNGGAVRVGN